MNYSKFSVQNAEKIMLSMIKGDVIGGRENLRYTFTDDAGRVCGLDGFRAFRIAAPLEGLPVLPEWEQHVDLGRVFPDAAQMIELEKPDLIELDALIAYDRKHGGKMRYTYHFGQGLPVLNAIYLRDALRVFPDARIYYKDNVSPILFVSEHGDAVVLPVRVDDANRERRKIIWSLSTFAAKYAG